MSHFLEIVYNYLFIQLAIIIFIAPFYLIYKYYHPESQIKHLALNEHIEDFLSSTQANYLIFFWAATEAICWFVIPEFLLLLVIFLRVRNKIKLLFYDILGTLVGSITGIVISFYANINLTKIPYITDNMVKQVGLWYHELGSFGLFFQPFSGVPYKVFVLNAHPFHLNLFWFVVLAVIVRVARYYLFYLIFVGLYPFFHRLISKNYIPIFLLSCFIFSLVFLKVYHSYGAGYVVNDKEIEGIRNILKAIQVRFH